MIDPGDALPVSSDRASPEPSLRTTASRGSAITLVGQVVRMLIMLASVIVLSRLLDQTDFGLIAMVVAIAGVAEIFRDFGLSMAALQAKTLTQRQKSNLFWINVLVGTALGAIIFALAWPIAAFYGQPELVTIVQAVAVVYPLGGLTAQFRVAINRSLRFGVLAIVDTVPAFLALAGAVVLAATGFGVTALVVQQVATALLTLIASVALGRWWPSLPHRGEQMRPLLTFGVSFAATQLLSYATRNADSIMIGRVWGPTVLGFYDRAFQLAVAPINQLNVPMSRVAIPVLARVVDDRARFASALREAQLFAAYITSTGLLVLGAVGVPLVTVLLGPSWTFTGVILGVLTIGTMFRAIQQISYWMFMSQGLAGSQLKLHLIGQPVIIALMLAGLPWGAVGVAAGNALGYGLFWLASLLWAGRVSQLDVRPLIWDGARTVLTVGLPAGLAALAVVLFVPFVPIALLLTAIAAAIAWLAVIWACSRRVRNEIKSLVKFAIIAVRRRPKS